MPAIRVALLTVSDRAYQGIRTDRSGPALRDLVQNQGWEVSVQLILPDDQQQISQQLVGWADDGKIDLILISGGTGFSERDVTPEATLEVIDRQTPGLAEWMRSEGMKRTPYAALSRAVTGIRKKTLIIDLPGSPEGAVENLGFILNLIPHAIQLIRGEPEAEEGHHLVKMRGNEPI